MPPLSGVRVLELAEGAAAGFCGRQFALWGADVAMAEGPHGSALRGLAPLWRTGVASGSAAFDYLAAGKRSIACGRVNDMADLLAGVDVLITDRDEALMSAFALSAAAMRQAFPALVLVQISPFGADGPLAGRRGAALQLQALSGYLSLNGPADGPPIAAPDHILDHAVGISAFVGALGALIRRERDGDGDRVDISAFETVCGLTPYFREQHLSEASRREGGTPEGARLLPCRDGYLSVAISLPYQEPAFRKVLGIPADPEGRSILSGERGACFARAWALYSHHSVAMTVQALTEGLEAEGVVCGKVQSVDAVLDDPQLATRRFFAMFAHPTLGPVPIAGRAARLSGMEAFDLGPSPALHGTAPRALAWTRRPVRAAVGGPPRAPLADLCVLDLTQAWIGPMAGVILADLGAEVIKVEGVQRPDIWRNVGQAPAPEGGGVHPLNRSAYFNGVNRNKSALGLDLGAPQGAALFRMLVAGCDVVLENFTPRVMGKLGLGYERLRQQRPDLVMTSFSGFGDSGPRADHKANGAAIEALAGWDAGHLDGAGRPVLMGGYPADPICGLQMAACTLVALYRKVRTGGGAHVEGSMLEAAAGCVGDGLIAAAFAREGAVLAADERLSFILPCRGDDRWITFNLEGTEDWARLTGAPYGPAVLSEPRFSTAAGRMRACAALRAGLADWTRSFDAEGLAQRLSALGLSAAAMRRPLEALDDPQLAARDWFYSLDAPGLGRDLYVGPFFRYDAAPRVPPRRPPHMGEDTFDILGRRLGRSAGDLAGLADRQIIGTMT